MALIRDAQTARDGRLLCGWCRRSIGQWAGSQGTPEVILPEGVSFNVERQVWRLSNRARARLGRDDGRRADYPDTAPGQPARSFPAGDVPDSGSVVDVEAGEGGARVGAVLRKFFGGNILDRDQQDRAVLDYREHAVPPCTIECPHCRQLNAAVALTRRDVTE